MPTLTICVTVDWEGFELVDDALEEMEAFRLGFPEIPLTHFICPAYFTRGWDPAPMAEKIRGPMRPVDEIGVHVHCWETLVDAAGVAPTLDPTWYIQGNGDGAPCRDGDTDYGHGVPLGRYGNETAAIIATAADLIVERLNAPMPVSFRAGGWMSSDSVLRGLNTAGIALDSSATDAPYFGVINVQLQGFNCRLGEWLPRLWGPNQQAQVYLANTLTLGVQPTGCDSLTAPYAIPVAGQQVLQAPDNGVLADYLTEDMIYQRLYAARQAAMHADVVHVCGFHQESAMTRNLYDHTENLPNLRRALDRFEALGAAAGGPEVRFNTISRVRRGLPGYQVTHRERTAADREREQARVEKARKRARPVTRRLWG